MTKYKAMVRGKQHEWGIEIPENAVEDMRADGFEVLEIANSIPAWAFDMGIGRVWVLAQDIWDAPSRIWRNIRRKP
jgi:hypothetical protein